MTGSRNAVAVDDRFLISFLAKLCGHKPSLSPPGLNPISSHIFTKEHCDKDSIGFWEKMGQEVISELEETNQLFLGYRGVVANTLSVRRVCKQHSLQQPSVCLQSRRFPQALKDQNKSFLS